MDAPTKRRRDPVNKVRDNPRLISAGSYMFSSIAEEAGGRGGRGDPPIIASVQSGATFLLSR